MPSLFRKAEHKVKEAKDYAHDLLHKKVNGPLVHGHLFLRVIAAKDLPNTDSSFLRRKNDKSDPYVTVDTYLDGKETCRLIKTSVVMNDLTPNWGETFNVSLCHQADSLYFAVKDLDLRSKNDHMGSVTIPIEQILTEETIKGWYPLKNKKGKPAGEIELEIKFTSADHSAPTNEVSNVIFPLRTGCAFTPYQDAHTPAVPPITDIRARDGRPYIPPCLWVDTLKAIKEAEKFIYIWGWAVWAELELVRTDDSQKWEKLGDVLKRKASEGCRVLIMVWDEAMSTDVYPVGMMGTHDEETFAFFVGTEVEVFKCPRQKRKTNKLGERFFARTTFTHHQKGVLVDAPVEGSEKRKIIGFMGGIDLTDGRYDTPEHSLFATLKTKHRNDFYCGVTPSNTGDVGPRQPWHDIHCHYEGPIALDLLANFENRWKKQNSDRMHKLLPVTEEHGYDLAWACEGDGSWNVQLFRSINSDSTVFETSILDKINARKGRLYDDSIQRAYAHHIRRAKRFIYIENQYFLGSCQNWHVMETDKCPNIVPVEICARVERAIAEGEEFRAYICIPMHPEGDPLSAAVQEILRWQSRTMEMMNHRIAAAIQKNGIDAAPTDYLYFFCPVKQEGPEDVPAGLAVPLPKSVAAKSRQSRRYMIYVHSKMAIFDDEYIIVGSANINDRSLSGNRDSEMALGAYQPEYTKETAGEGKEIEGDLRTFRLALWAEHCGAHMEEHLKPSSKECITAMKRLGDENLLTYFADEPTKKKAHLISYPLNFGTDGSVTSLYNCEVFPDTGGLIIGKASGFLPNSITT